MVAFLYRCPTTGFNVQGFTADDPSNDDTIYVPVIDTIYVPVICTMCTRVHLVNPTSGKVLAADAE